jgi:acylphosphatase
MSGGDGTDRSEAGSDLAGRGPEGSAGRECVRRRVVAHGRVQGVWFRESTRERAEADGVAGWVRNRLDGAVEAVFEGPADAVQRLVRFVETGPARARVERVEVKEESVERLAGFHVR